MTAYVIDTNVILAANEAHEDISLECVEACVARLADIIKSHIVVIDDGYRIIEEYQRKTNPKAGKGAGDVFLKWLLQNIANPERCALVALNEAAKHEFAEFPDKGVEASIDASDRKFICVAHTHPEKPSILQACDCKWLSWNESLKKCGVRIEFLCLDDITRFFKTKFPDEKVPTP